MNSSSDDATGDVESLDQPEARNPNVTTCSLPTNSQPTPPDGSSIQTSALACFLKHTRILRTDTDRAAKAIKTAVEKARKEKRRKGERPAQDEDLRYPSGSITSVLGQEEKSTRVPQPPSNSHHAPGVKRQPEHSSSFRRSDPANPLRSPSLQKACRARKAKSSTSQSTTAKAAESTKPFGPTKPEKLVKPQQYGPGHPAFPKAKPKLKSTKRTPVDELRVEIKNQGKLTTLSTISGKSEHKLPERTQQAIKKNTGLQKQIITKAASTRIKPSTR